MAHDDTHFDGGLQRDLQVMLSRRKLAGLGSTALLVGACNGWPFAEAAEPNVVGTAADGTVCIRLPRETSGPFPADGTNSRDGATVNVLDKSGIIRTDMRPSFGGAMDVADGVPLMLEVRLVDVTKACAPLANHLVYFWQCDAAGSYSLYERPDSNNLRGAALSDGDGVVRMTSIVPGCYSGRWPHIHFEVFANAGKAANGDDSLLVSQFALPKALCDAVYAAHAAYAGSAAKLAELTLEGDGIFANNTAEQLAAQTLTVDGDAASGYRARSGVGLAI
jgi:protocatechuate 3,4-dioxygenase beta subunit